MRHEVVVGLLIQDNRILLGLRSPTRSAYPNVWDAFGGHVEPGEDQPQTLVRELREELGITPIQWTYLETMSITTSEGQNAARILLEVHLYLVTEWSGVPLNCQLHEHSTIEWFSLDQAVRLDLAHPSYPQIFAKILR